MKLHVLGFCGPARAGKSTAASTVVGTFPGWNRLSFADPLRAMLAALGLTPEDLSLGKEQPCALLGGRTPRYAMQTLGTEWGRGLIDDGLWLRAAQHRAVALLGAGQSCVFDDVRFDNEAALIHALGGRVISLGRPGHGVASAHASERGINPRFIDTFITAADVLELRTKVFAYLNRFAA